MAARDLDEHVAAVRAFNRFYTRQIGVLHEGLLASPYSLTQARVIYDLAHRDDVTAGELAAALKLDDGYLSRILRGFKKAGLIESRTAADDGRRRHLRLSTAGRQAFDVLNARSAAQFTTMLEPLAGEERRRLTAAMATIQGLLAVPGPKSRAAIIRPPEPGDMGLVVSRHGLIYAEEFGWNEDFEALVAEIVADYMQNHDPKRERCWIAEVDGRFAGSVFLVGKSRTVAKLRLLIVDPAARGMGLGEALVDECIRSARRLGYQKMTLWTNSILAAARAIYVKRGFELMHEEAHHSFGHDLVGETWDLDLSRP